MEPELTADEVMRVIATLEAAWADEDDALAVLVGGGQSELPLAVLVARYGASRVQNMLLVVTGIARLEGAEQDRAVAELRQGLISHMTTVALSMISGWATSAGDDVQTTGDRARHVLQAILSFTTDGDDPEQVRALLTHLRTDAPAHS
ncbi:hypothetical protein J8N05_18695 [Streptomyces sp. BH-SS-21]|uniref:Uncharacterized protein n=1 Tax=Streptomyces liliiviolaceus TaxID=2823109 RepID=A0A941B797_9ACTN|nr:hypothetical protein [Streptomyces liliiviolaceus]MBQ0850226.1 hypothetical protein [Streptomyces liliiviolaceus]